MFPFFPCPSEGINPVWKYDTIISLTAFLPPWLLFYFTAGEFFQPGFLNCCFLLILPFSLVSFCFCYTFYSDEISFVYSPHAQAHSFYIHILQSLLLQMYINTFFWWPTVICDLSLHPVFLVVTALLLATWEYH